MEEDKTYTILRKPYYPGIKDSPEYPRLRIPSAT